MISLNQYYKYFAVKLHNKVDITILLEVGTFTDGNFYTLSSLIYHLVGYAKSSRVLTFRRMVIYRTTSDFFEAQACIDFENQGQRICCICSS